MSACRPNRLLVSLGLAIWTSVATLAASARAEGPSDRLLERVPADASLALVISDLKSQREEVAASPMIRGLIQLKPVQDWLKSEEGEKLRRGRRDFEAALAAPFGEIVDGLIGQAVVLSLHLPADAPPDQARGLLQTIVTDRELLERFINVANAAELGSGALRRVESHRYGGVAYSVRDFEDGRADEAYAILDDESFVWTNRESLLRDVIDRKNDTSLPCLTDDPALGRVRRALPDRAIASLLVDSRVVARLAEADPNATPFDELPAPLASYLEAIESLGAALQWREGPVLHVVEALDADRLPEAVRSWAGRPGDASGLLSRIPESALLVAAGHVDAPALYDLLIESVPDADRGRVEALVGVIKGLLLGRDLRGEILPELGPGVVGWMEPPPPDRSIREAPAVLVVSIADPGIAEAINNALRTALGFMSLDEDRKTPFQLVDEEREGTRVVALMAGAERRSTRVAFAIERGLLAIGTDVDAVASVFADPSAEDSERRPIALKDRDRIFPESSTFAYLDLNMLARLASDRRAELERFIEGRRGEDAEERSVKDDLDVVFELLPLFRGVYLTSALSKDATIAHRRLGLIVAD